MNTQNILNFYGSKFDIRLDSSEFYDYEISKIQNDYATDVLDLTTPITYTGLTIDTTLGYSSCSRNSITLSEHDNSINDSDYIYSGLTFNLNYNNFVSYFNNTYQHTILNNDIFTYVGIPNETHYFKISGFNNPIDAGIFQFTGFTKNITKCLSILNGGTCCPIPLKLNNKPWAYKFNEGRGTNNCQPLLKRRTEKGWTLDFIFNRENVNWYSNNVFYYIGVRGDNNIENYADNNLSFQFTSDKRIKWVSYRYSGVCDPSLGYSESYYLDQGVTPQLCTTGTTKDFNVTIVFDRYKRYTDCNLENDGGWNDMIPGIKTIPYTPPSGSSITSTQTTIFSDQEELWKKWSSERERRLGTLKIYLNGRPIYKKENWEEIIPSTRGSQPFIQSWGGGTGLMNNVHNGTSCFNMKTIKYYEEPLDFVHVRHNFLTRLNQYDFFICGEDCKDEPTGLFETGILTEFGDFIMTENNNVIIY
jgi:hypothetical protein